MTEIDHCPPGGALPETWSRGSVILGGYRVEDLLGEGSFGRVYRVSVDSPVPRRYALKQVPAFDPDARLRCLRELQTWIDLPEHPHLVTLRFPHLSDDALYLFADCIDGGSLFERRIDTTPLLLDFAIQLAWGLHACHAWGLVHGDVKPSNVFVTHEGVVKLGDFGIAQFRMTTGRARTPRGSVGFQSPEQCQGLPLDARSDLWSWAATVHAVAGGPLPPPLEQVVAQCMRADPLERPDSAWSVATRLRTTYRDLLPAPHARAEPSFPLRERSVPLDRLGHFSERWSKAPRDAGLPREGLGRRAQAVADLASFDIESQSLRARLAALPAHDPARAAVQRDLARLCVDLAVVHEQLDDTLGEAAALRRAMSLLDELGVKTPEEAQELARACISAGVASYTQRQPDIALPALDRAIELLTPLALDDDEVALNLSSAHMDRSIVLVDLGDGRAAVDAAEKAVQLRARLAAAGGSGAALANAEGNLGNALREVGRFADALDAYERAILRFRSVLAERPEATRNLALCYSNRGMMLLDLRRVEEAIDSFDHSTEVYTPLAENVDVAESLAWVGCNKGEALLATGRAEDALGFCRRSVEDYLRLVLQRPELSAELARAWASLGATRLALGDAREAEQCARHAVEIFAGLTAGSASPLHWLQQGIALTTYGDALQALAQTAKAADAYDEAIACLTRRLAAHPGWTTAREIAKAHSAKACMQSGRGDLGAAIDHEQQAMAYWDVVTHQSGNAYSADRNACAERLAELQRREGTR